MRIFIFIICFILFANTLLGQFVVCNSGTTNPLKDVQFINENIGLAVGENGTVIRSNDGGLNWSPATIDTDLDFVKVDFFDVQHAIAITTGYTVGAGAIFTSSDGGQSWIESDFENDRYFDIAILSDGHCIVTGYPDAVIKSTDFGVSWEVLVEDDDSSVANFGLISFLNDNVGFCWPYSDGSGLTTKKTIDGGETWLVIEATSEPTNTVIECVSFVSEMIGFQGGWYLGHMKKTSDGGNNWESVNTSGEEAAWEVLDFHITQEHPNAYYSSGWYGNINKSVDGGDSWYSINSGVESRLYGIFFITDEIGWAVGYDGIIIKTDNGGEPSAIKEITNQYNVTIYPNPSEELIAIDNPDNIEIQMIRIRNMLGQVVLASDFKSHISIQSLASGNYTIGFVTNEGTFSRSFVKQ